MLNERKLTKSELAKREDIIMKMKKNKRALVQKYGKDAEAVMYGRATKLAKKQAEAMDQDRIKELVKDALQNPKKADLNKDGKLSDYEKKRGAAIEKSMANEDLDLGHQDNEPHMLKADLYRIGKYAMELYQMVDKFEYQGEVDFPHWWQSKVIKAKDMLVSAKHYLDFEIKEPQIDAMVDVAQDTEAIDEAVGKFVVRPCSAKDTPFAVWQTSKDGENDKRIKGFKTKEDAKKFADEKNSLEENLKEGVWSLGSINDIKAAIQTMEMGLDMDDTELEQHLQDNDAYFYNVLGDDELHDPLSRAYDQAAMGNEDRARNELSDAIARAYDLLKIQMEKEGLNEEAPGESDMVASDIQKAMNASKGDEAKTHQLKKARIAMNKGDLDKAKKIADRIAKQLKSK